ncbi:MAG: glycosyl transferase family 1, partial [Oceanihabitans sp.]
MQLKEKFKLDWLADFRDPWTTIGYHKELKLTKASQKKHEVLEQKVLQTADQIIVTSNVTKQEFLQKTNKPITVITNGFDVEKTQAASLNKKFTLAHIGSLLAKRNPLTLWKVLQDLTIENEDFKKCFQLKLVGAVSEVVIKSIKENGLENYLNLVSYVSHTEAIKIQKESQVLLLIEIDSPETKCIIPGKLFEYMVSNRPIIALGPNETDVEIIINQTNTGNYFKYSDYQNLKNIILSHFNAFLSGNLHTNPIGLQKYSRKALTKALASLINK